VSCEKIEKCDKIMTILDKDMIDCQYEEAISEVCARCSRKTVKGEMG